MAEQEKRPQRFSSDRRERARQMVEAGLIGGARYGRLGGRKRLPRASEVAAAEIRKHGKEIARVAIEGLRHPSAHVRLKALDACLRIEARVADSERVEIEQSKAEAEQMSRDELIATLSRQLAAGTPTGEVLRERIEVIEGEGTEVRGLRAVGFGRPS
jgi:hypothetical protein